MIPVGSRFLPWVKFCNEFLGGPDRLLPDRPGLFVACLWLVCGLFVVLCGLTSLLLVGW